VPPPLPEHLFEQADSLAAAADPRQTDLRRALSNAYESTVRLVCTLESLTLFAAANSVAIDLIFSSLSTFM